MRSERTQSIQRAWAIIVLLLIGTVSARGQDITSNLAAHWTLNESSGTSAADSSGNNRTGTVFGTTSWQSGLISNCTYLNGSTYVRASSLMGNPANVTLAAWVNLSSADSSGSEVISIGDYVILRLDEGGTTLKGILYKGSSNWSAASYTQSFAGTGWHHVAVVFSDSSNYLRLYVDGAQVASVTVYRAVSYSGLGSYTYVGRHGNGSTTYDFTGKIDDARVYSRALSSSDIAALYTDGWATKNLLFVHNNTTLTSQEVLRRDKVMEWGYKVTLVQDSSAQSTYNTALGDVDVAYISEEVSANDVAYKMREATIGVVLEENILDDEFGVSTSGGSESTGTAVSIANNTHYITNVFSTGSLTITSSSQPLVYTNTTRASGFTSLGTVASTPSLGVIESGATLANTYNSSNTAFGRRVTLPFGGDTFNFAALNSNGLTILQRALAWAATPPGGTTGLAGHWKLSETSGTTAYDSSGGSNNGTYTNGVTLNATGPYSCSSSDAAADFDGTNDYVSISNESNFDITSAITVTAWFKVDTFTKSSQAIVTKGVTAWRIQRDGTTNQLAFSCTGLSTVKAACTTNVNNGQWHHVAGRFNGSTLSIYIDGVQEASVSVTGTISTNNYNVSIGENLESTGRQWDGKIYDVRVYNYALSATQIASLASGTAGIWAFSEGAGTSAADTSGSANNATLSGGASWTTNCDGAYALSTNGTGGIAATASSFAPPDEGTIAFWMKSNGPLSALGRIFGLGNAWEVRQDTNGYLTFDVDTASASNFVTSDALNESGRWYHVAATYNVADDTYAIYIDGQLHKSGTESAGLTSQSAAVLSFGTRTGSTDYWPGALRDFRVYNRRLCASEIATLYGLVGHWKLDETSGSTAADSSGLGNTGSLTGTVTWTAAADNNGAKLIYTDGDDYFTIPNSSSLQDVQENNYSVAAWFKPLSVPPGTGSANNANYGIVLKTGWHIGLLYTNTQQFELDHYLSGYTWAGTGTWSNTYAANKFYHVAGVVSRTAGTSKIYVDGVLKNTDYFTANSAAPEYGTASWYIGIGAPGAANWKWSAHAIVDDVRIYNRALCPTEVSALYNSGSPFEGVKIIEWVELQ